MRTESQLPTGTVTATSCQHGSVWMVQLPSRRVVRRPCERCLQEQAEGMLPQDPEAEDVARAPAETYLG